MTVLYQLHLIVSSLNVKLAEPWKWKSYFIINYLLKISKLNKGISEAENYFPQKTHLHDIEDSIKVVPNIVYVSFSSNGFENVLLNISLTLRNMLYSIDHKCRHFEELILVEVNNIRRKI